MRLSHQVSLRFVGRLSTQLVGLARAMALARLMPQEQFGVYGQGMLIATFLSPYVVMGLESTVPYFLTRLSARRQSGLIWATGAYLSAAGLLAAAALALLGDRLTAHWGGAGLGDLIPLIATILAFWQLPSLVAPVLQTRHRPVLAALTQPAIELPLAAAVVATYWQTGDLRAVFAVIAVFRALHFAVSGYLLRLPFRGEGAEFDTALAGEVARYTLPLGAASLIGTTNAVFDRMLIGWRFGPEEFAVYRTGAYELPFVALFVASVFPVLLPEMARMANDGRFDRALELWKEGVRRSAVFMLPVGIFSVAFAAEIVVLLWSSRYESSTPIFRLYTASLLVRIAQYGPLFVVFGRPRMMLRLMIASIAINSIAGLILIHTIGFFGPAIATVIERLAATTLAVVLAGSVSGQGFRGVLPWGALLRIVGLSVLAVLATRLAIGGLDPPWLRLLAGFALAMPLFGALGFATGTLTRADVDWVLSPLRRLLR